MIKKGTLSIYFLILAILVGTLVSIVVSTEETPAAVDEVDLVIDLVDGDSSKLKEGFCFAPWCGHCRKLAPIWKNLAVHFKDSDIKIARVNCDDNSGICGEYDVRGYPTIKLFVEGVKKDYKGGRTKDTLIKYIDKMFTGYLINVKDQESLDKILNDKKIAMIYVAESEESLKNDPMFDTFKKISFELFDTNSPNFVLSIGHSPIEGVKRGIILKRDGELVQFKQSIEKLPSWMRFNQYSSLTELNDVSFLPMSETFKNLVMFVYPIKPNNEEIEELKKISNNIINPDELTDFVYTYVSNKAYEKFTARYALEDLPALLVVREKGEIYYYDPAVKVDQESVLKYLNDIKAGNINYQYLDFGKYYFLKTINFIDEYKWFLAVAIIVTPIAAIIIGSSSSGPTEPQPERLPKPETLVIDDKKKKEN
ncbi:thioredoxin fold domain-containing protein [Cavenderia fasciculata]|uniref:Thioredoxin fold domain-containing protein n=1 Tax=Cavenderia fasciculata TaxID=261658 RepID=F4PJU6_CACFS|nr:thioredoxin fold domain-containing protein [Cavenderia fasciculata]EGG23870.1 thioredoxin fold domain-containing protein [Cavenderia fasciculata]|eukprot:XP_004361721.1 thioredoxin fold domain-containing protein [Cavenderia fasciculata]